MKKRLWMAAVLTVILLSGCSIRDYQVKRVQSWFTKLLPGNGDKEDGGQDREQAEILEESAGEVSEESMEEAFAESGETPAGNGEEDLKGENGSEDAGEAEESSQSEEISYKTKYVVNCRKSITLREAPSTSAAQIEEILLGEPVSFIKDDVDGFSKVVYQGKTGYVLAAYLGDTAPTVNDTAYYTMRVVNCRESISLRRSPSVKAGEICQIPLGAIVSYVDSAADGFYEITYLGKSGYALASYLEFYSSPENSSAEVTDTDVVRVSYEHFIQDGRECADIAGLNAQNQKVWEYKARSSHGMTELDAIQEIRIVDDVYYFNEDGTIVALEMSSGRVLWKNGDFRGASISYAVDEQGTLYLCGYYGPDLCAIDRKGNTLIYVSSFSPNLQWPYKVQYENGAVYITCMAFDAQGDREVVVRYDLATGGISY